MSAEIEDTFKKMMTYKGVKGIITLNSDGVAIRSTFENKETVQYAALVHDMLLKTRGVIKELNPSDKLESIRLRSHNHEIIMAPSEDYTLLCVHEPDAS